ncbi:phosphoenolpyruvate carboxykinase (GTP) [Hydrogenispora ethanolica]|uniref:Phosphoenolpyruvate carboxykinase [GTP] n=1 Tax=Hydrogenispora ethanolica TaxID=1082276 RepID=A0A4R1RSH9_HYDET|nr:phosphoenolpyruvate carboxykinase (GTP) [Hydrogenispora ethanolica]TCL69326.1 phosphoenolpyruvate carboxykinase (GTP) [Hydrogenispora ethanolica]
MNQAVLNWIDEMAKMTKPDRIVWIDGSEEERQRLTAEAISTGELLELNQEKLPGCVYHRTAENDVARVEHLTFICTKKKEDAGPTNNWMDPEEAYKKLAGLFDGAMKGRTMYVIPYIMGVPGSPFSKVGIELTDSIYVVLNMRIMTRMGKVALDQLGESAEFVKGLHSKADLNPERRFICHFPQDNTIWSVGSGYGGNVLLGKKCFALRIASYMGQKEGWMAEHMLILGIQDPQGNVSYVAAAFPSACGKTNLAMMIPPETFKGYKVWTVGDDIAWMRVGPDGRLWAINPEAGFFGVAPGTSAKSNPNALATVQKDTIFTNVVLTPEGTVWWEGMGVEPPAEALDWKGNPWTPDSGRVGAHPNSRFTAPARNCPSISPEWENPQGVPISAIIFGGRRAKVAPLVYQSFNWQHGVYVGAAMASETTSAATGAVGVIRRDPMAMLPFCGYNMGDYFAHWLEMGQKIPNPPQIFHVNWFRTNEAGKFIWPGFGENFRAIKWILERCAGQGKAETTAIGYVPTEDAIDLTGLDITKETMHSLLEVDPEAWQNDIANQKEFFTKFDRLPQAIEDELVSLEKRLQG